MQYTKILLILIFFVHLSQAMNFAPTWEKIRKDALSCAQEGEIVSERESERQLLYKKTLDAHYLCKKINKAGSLTDIIELIRQEAEFGINFFVSDEQTIVLMNVIDKAQPRITKHDMHYCLKALECFFTDDTKNYQEFEAKKTIHAAKLLLCDNLKNFTDDQKVYVLP